MGTRAALLALLFVCCLLCALAEGKPTQKTVAIDVKPSGQVAHQSVKLDDGITCVFTHAAVGGTNEEWSMTLAKTGKNTYVCTIERPEQTSYLFFMSFAASVLEHDVQKAEVFDNSGALLQDEDFVITDGGKSVKQKDGGFQSNLAKITLTAMKSVA